jgi:acetyltransferase-like isoleucine patch superfamily enzyme
MKNIVRVWRTWKHSRKFVKVGRRCRFPHKYLEVDGHVELGDECRFRNNVILRTHGQGKIIFGNRSGCSYFCILEATKMIKIGNFTGIAEFTVIRDTNHFVIGTDEHWRITPYIAEPIVIGDCVLIGSRCYINPGVAIGDGAVIAPGSVVTKDVGPLEVWAGNPARKIAHRTQGVPAKVQERYLELLAKYGLKEQDRRGYEEDEARIKEVYASGVNRAAEERDRLRKLFEGELNIEADD